MASAIDVTVPAPNSALTSANIRAQFATTASEITTAQNQITTLQGNVGALQTTTAPQNSPSFTGIPVAPTATAGTNTTQLATTAFVAAAVAAVGGGIAEPVAGTTIYGRGGTPTPAWTPVLPLTGNTPATPIAGNVYLGALPTDDRILRVWGTVAVTGADANFTWFSEDDPSNTGNSQWYMWGTGTGAASATVFAPEVAAGGLASEAPRLTIYADAAIVVGNPTGGKQAPGVINAAGFMVNGVAVGTSGGTVSNVTAGTGLATTPAAGISTTGSIALATIGTPGGPYTNATVTIDAYGRVTTASSGTGGGLPDTGGTMTGALGINTTGAGTALAVQTSGNNTVTTLDAAGAGFLTRLQLRRAGGDFTNVPTSLQPVGSNYQLGMIELLGWDGVNWGGGGVIQCQVPGGVTWNAGNRPVRMVFQTTRSSNPNPSTAMQIGADGGLVVGNAPGGDQGAGSVNAEKLQSGGDVIVLGDVHIDGELWVGGVKIA